MRRHLAHDVTPPRVIYEHHDYTSTDTYSSTDTTTSTTGTRRNGYSNDFGRGSIQIFRGPVKAEIEYSAGRLKFFARLRACKQQGSQSSAPPIRTMPRPAPDNSGQTERVRPVPAPLAPSLARPSCSAPAQTYLTLHNTNCGSNKSPQSLFHCLQPHMRRYEKPRAAV